MLAAVDNFGELLSPIVLALALLGAACYAALSGPETLYDQGIFRHWREGVSVSDTLLMLTLVFVLRALFLLIELPVAEYLSKRRKPSPIDGIAGGVDDGIETREVAGGLGTTADTESSTRYLMLVRALGGNKRNGVAMLAAGVFVNVALIVVESAWSAWHKCAADDDACSRR